MDEIEYKLKSNNSVLIVNAIDKLINIIQTKYVPGERQRFVLENEELRFLREKCSSTEPLVSLTACQGLLALVEMGVLEIANTMSTVATLLPSAHNFSAIISTMAGLLILDLKGRLLPEEQYRCQFSLRSPQHPFIRVLEKNPNTEGEVLNQMHALCTHPDPIISSNSLELLRPVFLWLAYNPQRSSSIRPWQLLLSLPESPSQSSLLLNCIACQQICNPELVESAFAAISAVVDAVVFQQKIEHVMAFVPLLARISTEMVKNVRDPRSCYSLIERCFALDNPAMKNVSGITLLLLSENLNNSSALSLHELFNLCLHIITKYECATVCFNAFVGMSLQWLHTPTYLTENALQVASKLVDMYEDRFKHYEGLYVTNLRSNPIYQSLVYTDRHLFSISKLLETYEMFSDNAARTLTWFDNLVVSNDYLRLQLLPFFTGIALIKHGNLKLGVKAVKVLLTLVSVKKEVSVAVLPVLVYIINNDARPAINLECLRGLPSMASTKENVPAIVCVLNKLRNKKSVPTSLLIMLFTTLAETQVRCFPYLQEFLADTGAGMSDDVKWELDIAKAIAVKRICELRATTHGVEVVPVISSLLNRCTDRSGAASAALSLRALRDLWRARAVAPPPTWRALEPRLANDTRPLVQTSLCELLSEIPSLRVATPEYDKLLSDTARTLWRYVAEAHQPGVAAAACDALANYNVTDYTLKHIPEIYRKTVSLPLSYCKTPADAARKPEDVLDYIPGEVWPEMYKYTNQAALSGVKNMVKQLMAREIVSMRSGVYHLDSRGEPPTLAHLPGASVVRGVLDCFRRQVLSPSYEISEPAFLALFETVTSEFPKPLPSLDLSFIDALYHKGETWRAGCFALLARQSMVSPSSKALLESALQEIQAGNTKEFDAMLLFNNLAVLCRGVAPNTLRGPIEACLAASFEAMSKAKRQDGGDHAFIKQILKIKECLEDDKIHDANRTLLSLTIENYFSAVPDSSVAWKAMVETCVPLSSKYLERMTSPTGWWEVSAALLRKSTAVRAALAASAACDEPLVWLNETLDAHADEPTQQEFSLRCILPALRKAAALPTTGDWLLQLMARSQVAFNETEKESAKLYLCDVFMLSVIVFSGLWAYEPDCEALLASGETRRALLPAAAAALLDQPTWAQYTHQMLEWLCHTQGRTQDEPTALSCRRALLALRHTHHFAAHKVWMRLDHSVV